MFRHILSILKKDRIETFLDSYDILKPMKKDWRQYGESGKNRWLNQTEKDSKEQK